MNFCEFQEQIIEKLNNHFKGSVKLTPHTVRKNNGVMLDGIVMSEENHKIAPTIYLQQFYDEYEENVSIDRIVEQVIELYESSRLDDSPLMNFFFDYGEVKKYICYKLVNYEKNKDMLENAPHLKHLDLAMVLYCKVPTGELKSGTIQITNEHLKIWNVKEKDVLMQALNNTPDNLQESLYTMRDILLQMGKDLLGHDISTEELMALFPNLPEESMPMYVLTNSEQIFGASVILYEGVLSRFANQVEDDLYILPSSIHEVILIPVTEAGSPKTLSCMVREINETQLDPQEVLSDHVYLYSRKFHRTIIAD